ncbi:MAG: helix-turn-helix domain-containing protein [Bacilli bacterium]|nr:helix-turn-helix domain-containing protein [Bacilli bacterium]
MFKDKLKHLRESAGFTQKELAEKIYVSRSAINKWELGNGIPSDVNLDAICKLFNVSEEWLLDRNDLKIFAKKIEKLLSQKEKDYILEYYSEFNNEECGKWNTSLKAKWYDYKTTEYFEENFNFKESKTICNIGIGPGHWDRYLSYHMNDECKLISIDIDSDITETFRLCLENEENKRNIEIVNSDIFEYIPSHKFDIITMIGSTVKEIGLYKEAFKKAISMLNDNGELFYSSVTKEETIDLLLSAINDTGHVVNNYQRLEKYGKVLILAKIMKE